MRLCAMIACVSAPILLLMFLLLQLLLLFSHLTAWARVAAWLHDPAARYGRGCGLSGRLLRAARVEEAGHQQRGLRVQGAQHPGGTVLSFYLL